LRKLKKHMRYILSFLLVISLALPAVSQDRVFTYTYQSGVLNPGQREIEVWNTLRSGRSEFYRALDSRIEFEFGIAKNLQVAFYLNSSAISEANVSGNFIDINSVTEWSFSNEWKYKLSDPVANSIGSALYAEIGVSPREFELEAKLILDKKIGRTTHALNLVAEPEWETEVEEESDGVFEIENEFEFKFEFDYGLSYNINNSWNIGLEARNVNEVEEGEWETSVLFAGPGFSYVKGPIWINLTILPQVTGLKYENSDDSGTILEGHEKLETRLLFSYVF
jgi:hypothetical protein